MQGVLSLFVLVALLNGAYGFRPLRINRGAMMHRAAGTRDTSINDEITTLPTSASELSLKSLRLAIATSLVGLLAIQGVALARDNEGTKTDKKFGE